MEPHVRERENYVQISMMVGQASLRRRTESAIDALLALLDELDSDTDLEPDNDDEPSLGWPQDGPQRLCKNTGDDREGASWPDDMNQCHLSPWRCMASEDDEPSLGASQADEKGSQTFWASGAHDDAEGDEHDGCEPDVDAENDPAELGIADQDALDDFLLELAAGRAFMQERDRILPELQERYYTARALAGRKGKRLTGAGNVRLWG